MTLSFTIPGVPVAKGRPKFARRGKFVTAYTPAKTRHAEETLAARAMEFRPPEPLFVPLALDVIFFFPIPESWPKWKRDRALSSVVYHDTKPDLDNCLKLLKDALNAVFWLDDKQIWYAVASKRYGAVPRIEVIITPFDQAEKATVFKADPASRESTSRSLFEETR
jgi:Holliday junction resolvase RusA-like endonuclease